MNQHKATPSPDFILSTPHCPECGGKPDAILEVVYGWAQIDEDGNYAGYTDVLWDSQQVDIDGDKQIRARCGDCRQVWTTD